MNFLVFLDPNCFKKKEKSVNGFLKKKGKNKTLLNHNNSFLK